MENRNAKRIRLSSASVTNIGDITDELLIEIFIRLASPETVIACKLVSKHWLSLLSSEPKFVTRFVEHKKQKQEQEALLWTLLSMLRLEQTAEDDDIDNKRLIDNHNKVFSKSNKYSLDFLPGGRETYNNVAATCKDLVLLCKKITHEDDLRCYYICNPVTKCWLALPPTPSPVGYDFYRQSDNANACLICEPPPYGGSNTDGDYRSVYRFRVVVAEPDPKPEIESREFCMMKVMVFCSEISRWIEINLRVPINLHQYMCDRKRFQLLPCNKGMVCVSHHHYFGMFDAFFDLTTTTTTTTYSLEARPLPITTSHFQSFLLECGGRLISVSATRYDNEQERYLDNGLVLLCSVLDLDELCWKQYRYKCIDNTEGRRCRTLKRGIRMVNVHPTNPQFIYILTGGFQLLLCDTVSFRLKDLGQYPVLISDNKHNESPFYKRLQLQYWPTPLPILPSSPSSDLIHT